MPLTKPKKRMTWNSGGSGILSQPVPHFKSVAEMTKSDGKNANKKEKSYTLNSRFTSLSFL